MKNTKQVSILLAETIEWHVTGTINKWRFTDQPFQLDRRKKIIKTAEGHCRR